MPIPDSSSVTRILREAAEFTRRVGAESEAAELEKFCNRFQTEKATLKLLLGPVDKAMTQALRKIRAALFDERLQPNGWSASFCLADLPWVACPDPQNLNEVPSLSPGVANDGRPGSGELPWVRHPKKLPLSSSGAAGEASVKNHPFKETLEMNPSH